MDVIIQADKDADACYVAFSSRSLARGSVTRSQRISEDITLDFDSDGRLLGLDVLNASRVLSTDFWQPRLEALVGVKEAAEIAGVQRSNFVRDYASSEGFPAPVCELATGRIWRRSQVEEYLNAKKPKSGRGKLAS
jgi:uncharacterized protein YuzE